ncbi:uncharacterized protein LOC134216084 [Armigeres subalbatus]|uniref:uncharacterized protein LOC134216084 n=1 Tax=Armigeres subalbatus TaxID=124917 RepID=UPI002ED221E2
MCIYYSVIPRSPLAGLGIQATSTFPASLTGASCVCSQVVKTFRHVNLTAHFGDPASYSRQQIEILKTRPANIEQWQTTANTSCLRKIDRRAIVTWSEMQPSMMLKKTLPMKMIAVAVAQAKPATTRVVEVSAAALTVQKV